MAEDLMRLVAACESLRLHKQNLAELEEEVKKQKAIVLQLEREDVPDLMAELGVKDITLSDGSKVSVVEDCDARITDANRSAAFAWLQEHGYGGLIKTFVAVQFNKGEHDAAVETAVFLRNQLEGRDVVVDETVHAGTLKAFVKERLTKGEAIPMDLFGVFPYNKAVLSNGKK